MSGYTVNALPEIAVETGALRDLAQQLTTRAQSMLSATQEITTAWTGTSTAYQEPSSQDQVHGAMWVAGTPAEDWAEAATAAAAALETFCTDAEAAASELQLLSWERTQLRAQGRDVSDDAAQQSLDTAIGDFNSRLGSFIADWIETCSTAAQALDAAEALAPSGMPKGPKGGMDWVGNAQLADALPAPEASTPAQVAERIKAMTPEELRAWSLLFPAEAAILAANRPKPGTVEAKILALSDQDKLDADDTAVERGFNVDEIAKLWASLSPEEQKHALLMYPVLGLVDGIPFEARAQANVVNAGAVLDAYNQQIQVGQWTNALTSQAANGNPLYSKDVPLETAERNQVMKLLEGGDVILYIARGADGQGTIVSANRLPDANTEIVSTFVPGTGSNLGSWSNERATANALAGTAGDAVVITWQGSTPAQILLVDNVQTHFAINAGKALASFDQALDMELPAGAVQNYTGHSAGGEGLASGVHYGLSADRVIFAATQGDGSGLWQWNGRIEDGGKVDQFYQIISNDDPVGATRLIYGFPAGENTTTVTADEFGDMYEVHGHVDYFKDGSTSLHNLQSIVAGEGTIVMKDVPQSVLDELPEGAVTEVQGARTPNPQPGPAPVPPGTPQPTPTPVQNSYEGPATWFAIDIEAWEEYKRTH